MVCYVWSGSFWKILEISAKIAFSVACVYARQNNYLSHKQALPLFPGKSLVSRFSWQCADLGSSKPLLTARAAANVHLTVTPMRKLPPLVSVKRIISGGNLIRPQWHAQVRNPVAIWWCSPSPVCRNGIMEPVVFCEQAPLKQACFPFTVQVLFHVLNSLGKHWKINVLLWQAVRSILSSHFKFSIRGTNKWLLLFCGLI